MKRICSILVSLFILLQSIDVHATDLLGLGAVFEHAEFHETEYGDDWLTFYRKHFGLSSEEHVENQHQEKHEELPQHDNLCSSVAHVFIINSSHLLAVESDYQKELTLDFYYLEGNSYFLENEIFQPPIFA